MKKKTVYYMLGGAILLIIVLLMLSKAGILGNKEKGKEIEVAQVDAMTIIETVSATGKISPKLK